MFSVFRRTGGAMAEVVNNLRTNDIRPNRGHMKDI